MGDMAEVFQDWNEHRRKQRYSNLDRFVREYLPKLEAMPGLMLTKHTDYHYSVTLVGERNPDNPIQYMTERCQIYPSRRKWVFMNKTHGGHPDKMMQFILNRIP